ncbi:MAG: hypothetical protein HY703_04005 [Gemmatimonadetes bacterium]|nr:hypothetical protein [Gemmatimonadota bacterium]
MNRGPSTWLPLFLAAGLVALGMLHFALSNVGTDRHPTPNTLPSRGRVAPLHTEWLGAPEVIARIPVESLGAGAITGLAVAGGSIYLIQKSSWLRWAGGRLYGPFGSRQRGAPNSVAGAVAVAARGRALLLLEGAADRVSVWTEAGERRQVRSLQPLGAGALLIPEQVGADDSARLYVSLQALRPPQAGRWLLLRYGPEPGRVDTLFGPADMAEAAGIFSAPRFAVRPDGSLLLVSALDYEITWRDGQGRALRKARREDPPLWPIPDSLRRNYLSIFARIPPHVRHAYRLPTHFPPVRYIFWRSDDRILVFLSAPGEMLHLELLDSQGAPLAHLTGTPLPPHTVATDTAVYSAQETLEAVLIQRRRLRMAE